MNGALIYKETALQHQDRILLGSNNLYVFVGLPSERKKHAALPIDWEYCQNEIANVQGLTKTTGGGGDDDDAQGLRSEEVMQIRADLVHLLPLVSEANAMSEELLKVPRTHITRTKKHDVFPKV